ncbi:uncharacterized protein HGUI_00536 [Hanseniaspora guilliermondii]|uniref:N-(5'-phosphoribosyl)anthranilate isomerase n=1 Tax=Hanseniaspora guilliermondii TaxID=56406 RepID=A0A1L0AW53_9ASCO|nr:uncharacterized protein HGUI_00536 [Hanseniaspora guilliermondii]
MSEESKKIIIKKCCGLKQIDDIEYILNHNHILKYTHLGIILVPNKGRSFPLCNSDQFKDLINKHNQNVNVVGVVQKQTFEDIDKILQDYPALPITHIQIHDSNPSWFELICELYQKYPDLKFIKRFVFPKDCETIKNIIQTDTYTRQISDLNKKLSILFDSESGGNGEVQDWNGINDFLQNCENLNDFNIIIAGGLNPSNVLQCVNTIQGINGVDVSGGLEGDVVGKKDFTKLHEFAKNIEL